MRCCCLGNKFAYLKFEFDDLDVICDTLTKEQGMDLNARVCYGLVKLLRNVKVAQKRYGYMDGAFYILYAHSCDYRPVQTG